MSPLRRFVTWDRGEPTEGDSGGAHLAKLGKHILGGLKDGPKLLIDRVLSSPLAASNSNASVARRKGWRAENTRQRQMQSHSCLHTSHTRDEQREQAEMHHGSEDWLTGHQKGLQTVSPLSVRMQFLWYARPHSVELRNEAALKEHGREVRAHQTSSSFREVVTAELQRGHATAHVPGLAGTTPQQQ
jgi:hypothetical protein